jgi:tetratricopeptide (TPR) repeat protein
VPLFVEELVKAVLETGLVQEETERYVLRGPLPTLAIPATLHDALMARLDRLGPAKSVAQLGAVLGREFAYELLQAVVPMDEPILQHSLAQLVEAELLYQRGQPPQATYVFKHALIRDAAYQALLRSTRQQYHQRVTQVLESQFPEIVESQPELLAHHALRGEVWDKAVAYGREAGSKAVARSAYHEAVTAFEQALTALTHLPETRDTREQAIDLRLALRSALLPSGDLGRILACVREAEALAAALDDPRRLAQISVFLSNYFHRMGAYDQAIVAAQRTLALATASGEVDLQALANGCASAQPPRARATIVGRSTASSRLWLPSIGRGAMRASVRQSCLLWPPVPSSLRAMPSWARSPRVVPSGTKGCGLPRRWLTPRASCLHRGGLACWPSVTATSLVPSRCSNEPWASVRTRTSLSSSP